MMNRLIKTWTMNSIWISNISLGICVCGILAISVLFMPFAQDAENHMFYFVAGMMVVVFLCCCLAIQSIIKHYQYKIIQLLWIFSIVMASILVRASLLYFASGDFNSFLVKWIDQLRIAPGLSGLSTRIGDYNMPYLYLLWIVGKITPASLDLFSIKFISILFDVLLAYFAMRLVSLKTDRIGFHFLAFILVFSTPTVVLNSAMWAQCDAIYTSFVLGAIYYALRHQSKRCYIFLAIAFGFKLQTIFIFPLFLIFLWKNKIKWKDCYLFFATFIALLLPAILVGMPFKQALSVYYEQVESYPNMHSNAMTIYTLIGNVSVSHFTIVAILICFLSVLSLLYFLYLHKDYIGKTEDYILIAFLFSIMVPFLLPRMHDRYFFMADILAVLVFLYHKKYWIIPVLVIFCSYTTYATFLMSGQMQFLDYRLGSIILMFLILIILKSIVTIFIVRAQKEIIQKKMYEPSEKSEIDENNFNK